MSVEFTRYCADINSEYCPCMLAETNHCTFCSRLSGKNFCDCSWNGICILNEKFWRDKDGVIKITLRKPEAAKIMSREAITDRLFLYELIVSDQLAHQLERPGAFIFLKTIEDDCAYYFPISIMQIKGTHLLIAIEETGPKSKRFLQADTMYVMVKGPYYNGILGNPWLDSTHNGRVLLIAGGTGMAPALPIIHKLINNHNKIICILAPGKAERIFILPYLVNEQVAVHIIRALPFDGFSLLDELLEERQFDLIVSAGPDRQHSALVRFFADKKLNLPMAATNNSIMCCGEGLCGSCSKTMKNGKIIKMCKEQVPFTQIQEDE